MQEAISKIVNGTAPGFISGIEESLAKKQRSWALTESIIRSPRNYLAEGGILRVLLLESLSVKDQLGLFYVLSYIYGVYSVKYPSGTPRMEDDDYVLYSKVEAELRQVVPELMLMLKDTYEAWVVNEVVWYGGLVFIAGIAVQGEEISFIPHPNMPLWRFTQRYLPVPKKTYLVWQKNNEQEGLCWRGGRNQDWGVYVDKAEEGKRIYIGRHKLVTAWIDQDLSTDAFLKAIECQEVVFYAWKEAPERIYAVPNTPPSLPPKFFKSDAPTSRIRQVRQAIGCYEALYGSVSKAAILGFEKHIEELTWLSEGDTSVETTKKILKFYHSYLKHPSTDWKRNIATISILLNVAHNNGSMAEDLGSKYTTTKEHGVDADYLYKLSNLHKYIPQGTDHKTLEGIYNNCFQLLAGLR